MGAGSVSAIPGLIRMDQGNGPSCLEMTRRARSNVAWPGKLAAHLPRPSNIAWRPDTVAKGDRPERQGRAKE